MDITKVKRFLPVIIGVVCLGIIVSYRITDNIVENKARAKNLTAASQVTVEISTAGRKHIQPVVTFSAGLEPEWIADISAKVDGRIKLVAVNEGDRVEAGTVAATIDNSDVAGQIMQAKGNLMAAKSNLEQAELDYQRYAALAKDGAVAGQVLDNARTKRDAVRGQLQTSEGALALVEEKAANLNIVIPRDGVVTKRHLQEGAFVNNGAPVVTVADTTTLLAKATIGESQIADLTVGTPVEVSVDAMGNEEFVGIITMISPVAQLPSRTFTADIAIDNQDGRLRAGMFAKVIIPSNRSSEVLAVPESAIIMREDQASVYVVNEDQTVTQRIIKTGIAGDGWTEVKEGLEEGDRFAVSGQNKLRDGMTVNVATGGASS